MSKNEWVTFYTILLPNGDKLTVQKRNGSTRTIVTQRGRHR